MLSNKVIQRSRLLLDGEWEFWIDPDNSLSQAALGHEANRSSRLIQVPAAWQSQSEELRFYSGAAWYQRKFEMPADWWGESHILLGIDAADYFTEVWINDVKIGNHEGGYLPFEMDATAGVLPGTNTITIRVDDPPSLFPEIPHGKQGWYGPLSGIWQSVWLERRSQVYIQSIRLAPDLETGWVQAQVTLRGIQKGNGLLQACILSPDGESSNQIRLPIPEEGGKIHFALQVLEPLAWSPDHPNLYSIEVELQEDGQEFDSASKHFGFRTIEARDGRLFLNGELIYLRGALDQDYYPGTIASPPTTSFLEDQIVKAKELGLNCLRCHIKVADPRYYDTADRLGMLIWTELPNWSVFTEQAGLRGRETLRGILERDGHHPSIIAWTIINENWGMDLVNNPAHRAWLKETYQWMKVLDPTRLVVDNSPCEPSFHIQTDIEDYHFYRGIPDHRGEWDQFVLSFAARAPWTFCSNGLTVRTGKEPLIISEFGNWGLPDLNLLLDEKGKEPWWVETGYEWGEGVVYPQGVRSRFHNLGLERVFGSWQSLIEATQWQEYTALKYQIESMRKRPEICGYIITELTDVHWECNGLLDMHRNPKIFHECLIQVNADTIIIPEWDRVAYWPGEMVQIRISIAHGSGAPLSGVRLNWRLEGEAIAGEVDAPALLAGQVLPTAEICFSAPETYVPIQRQLLLELYSQTGCLLTTNQLELTIFPFKSTSGRLIGKEIYTAIPGLAEQLLSLGYPMTANIESARLIITDRLDDGCLSFLQKGGRVLALADRAAEDGFILPGIQRVARTGTAWAGDWASSFSWINRRGAFKQFPGGPLIDHSFDGIIPEHVLTGFKEWDYANLVRAGIFVGWIHKPAVLIGERFYGNGKAVINTFRLTDKALGSDPTARVLMDTLIELTIS